MKKTLYLFLIVFSQIFSCLGQQIDGSLLSYFKVYLEKIDAQSDCDQVRRRVFDNYYYSKESGNLFEKLKNYIEDNNNDPKFLQNILVPPVLEKDMTKTKGIFLYAFASFLESSINDTKAVFTETEKNARIRVGYLCIEIAKKIIDNNAVNKDEKEFISTLVTYAKKGKKVKDENEKKCLECLASFFHLKDPDLLVEKIDNLAVLFYTLNKQMRQKNDSAIVKSRKKLIKIEDEIKKFKTKSQQLEKTKKQSTTINLKFDSKIGNMEPTIINIEKQKTVNHKAVGIEEYSLTSYTPGRDCNPSVKNVADKTTENINEYFKVYSNIILLTYKYIDSVNTSNVIEGFKEYDKQKTIINTSLTKLKQEVYLGNNDENLKGKVDIIITGQADNHGGSFNKETRVPYTHGVKIEPKLSYYAQVKKDSINKDITNAKRAKPKESTNIIERKDNPLCFIIGGNITNLQLAFLRAYCVANIFSKNITTTEAFIDYTINAYEYETTEAGDNTKRSMKIDIDFQDTNTKLKNVREILNDVSSIFEKEKSYIKEEIGKLEEEQRKLTLYEEKINKTIQKEQGTR